MAIARFRIFHHQPVAPDTVIRVGWRLLATNNRDLGRSAVTYADRAACREALRRLQAHAADLRPVTVRTGPSHWGWRLLAGDRVLAVGGRDYQRRIQAERAAAVVLALIPAAEVAGIDQHAPISRIRP